MSTTVDQRVVEMRFDNKQFESGANQSINTIGKLKQALNFSDSSKAFDNIQKAADGVDMSNLGESVDTVKAKFSALDVAAATVLSKMVDKAMGVGKRIAGALGLDAMTSGFQEYELKMGSIQTILANTQSRNAEVSKEAVESVNVTATKAVEESEKLNAQLLENTQKAHSQQLEVFNENAQAELKAFSKSSQAQLKALDKQFKEEQKKQNKADQKEMEAFEKNAQKKLKKLQEQQKDEVEAVQDAYDKKYDALAKEQTREMELLQENHSAKLDLLQEEYMQQLKIADEDRYNQIKAIDDQIKSIQGLTEAEEAEREAAERQENLTQLERAVEIAKNSAARKNAEKALADYRDQIAREDLEKARKNQIEELEARKDAINEEFEEKKDKIQEEYEERKEGENKIYDEEKEALKERQKLRQEAVKENYEAEMEALEKQQEKELEKLQEQQKKQRENLQERISDEQEALSERQSNERDALSEQLEDQKEAITDRQDKEREALQERQKEELAAISERHEQELANIETEKNAKISALQTSAGMTKGSTLEDVNKALNDLNEYSDKTIYNFAEMTRNIGTFTAAGVDLDTSVSAIKGIANVAALSGSNAEQASMAMYQLSQAIAGGVVQLEDWRSVENASMGGKLFQESIKETARVHGVSVDQIIAKNGSFQKSLQEGWLTSDILLETLSKFTGDLTDEQLRSMGYTEEQIVGIQNMAKNAVDAATDVKTFSQLLSTLSEEAGSGWASTFEIIFGNFEEAKKLWSEIYKVLGNLISSQADARNDLLQSWKDLGGRQAVIDGLTNAWRALVAIAKPIKEAFQDVFPPATADTLVKLSEGFRDLTSHLIISSEASEALHTVFVVLFTILKAIIAKISFFFDVLGLGIKVIWNVASLVLSMVDSLVDLVTSFGEAITSTKEFNDIVETLKGICSTISSTVKDMVEAVKGHMDALTEKMSGTSVSLSSSVGPAFTSALGIIGGALSKFADFIVKLVQAGSLEQAVNVIKGVVMTVAGINLNKLLKTLRSIGDKGIINNLNSIKSALVDTFKTIQKEIKAKALKDIAEAIAILVASLVVLSLINPDKLDQALGSMMVLFYELFEAMKLFDTLLKNNTIESVAKIGGSLLALSFSILILSGALKILSTMSVGEITKGIIAIGVMAGELAIAVSLLQAVFDIFDEGKIKGLIPFAIALGLLTIELKAISTMSIDELNVGLTGIQQLAIIMASAITELQAASSIFKEGKIQGLITFALSIDLLLIALEVIGNMKKEKLEQGLLGILGLVGIMATVLSAMTAINGKVKSASLIESAASILIMAAAILVLTPALKVLATMDYDDIGRSLGVLAGTFVILGGAGLLLAPLSPIIVALATAIKNIGIAALAAGVGVNLLAIGLPLLAVAGVTATTGLLAALAELIAGLLVIVKDAAGPFADACTALLDAFCEVIITNSNKVAKALMVLIDDSLKAVSKYIPSITESLVDIIDKLLNTLALKMPEFVDAVVNLVVQFLSSLTKSIEKIPTDSLAEALTGVGILVALMNAFAELKLIAPAALAGVKEFGKFVAELAIVIAAAGAISKIKGVNWLLESGGEFLYKIGDAIGKFVGGIVGGVVEGFTENLPQVAKKLSKFMENLEPFLKGASSITPTVETGVKTLVGVIEEITKASVINGLASWFTGENNLQQFGKELKAFGSDFAEYYNETKDINPSVVTASANAAQSLAEFANNLPDQGGIAAWFAGDNRLSVFGQELVAFGGYFAQYADKVKDIKPEIVTSSANAAMTLAKFAENLPNQGGIVSWFTGDNRLSVFGQELVSFGGYFAQYANKVAEIKPKVVTASANAAKALSELAMNLPNQGGIVSWFTGDNDFSTFGNSLKTFGDSMKSYYLSVEGIKTKVLSDIIVEVNKLVDLAKGIAGVDTSGMARFGSDLKKMGDKGITEFLNAFKDSESKVKSTAKQLCTLLFNQMQIFLPSSSFKSIGKGVGTDLASGLESGKSQVGPKARAIGQEVERVLKKNMSYNTFYNIGANAGSAIADGIYAYVDSVSSAAADLAQSAIDSANEILEINSPSKVFTQIGQYVSMGLANGITNSANLVELSGEELATTAIDPVQLAMDRIHDILDEDPNFNPCIVPTIDLSQVMDGADQISSMFGGFGLNPTSSLAQAAYNGFARNLASASAVNDTDKQITDKLDKLIDVSKDNTQTINHNTFNIQSTDPKQAAEEVGYVLQHRYERGKAAWAR